MNSSLYLEYKGFPHRGKNKWNIPVDKALVVFSLWAMSLSGHCVIIKKKEDDF